MNEASRKD